LDQSMVTDWGASRTSTSEPLNLHRTSRLNWTEGRVVEKEEQEEEDLIMRHHILDRDPK
jgi:hypothetical protein